MESRADKRNHVTNNEIVGFCGAEDEAQKESAEPVGDSDRQAVKKR